MAYRRNHLMSINLDDVKRIAKRYGRAEHICEALDISFTDYNYLMYYQYPIADNEMRSFAFRFAESIEYGRAEHKMLEPYMNKLEGYSFIYKKKKYRYKEYEDKDFIITNVNYDSNQFFSAVLEKSRLMTLKIQPNLYSHIQTTDELIESFLIHNKIKEVYCEANFSQSELIKKLKRRFTVKPFYSKQNKIERIVNASISIYERVYFPTLWITSPEETNTEKYIETSHGRGFIALQQLLNFSDIATENCRKGDDFSFVDFPDALASLINHAKRSYSDTETERPTFEDKIKVLLGDED